jgi:hypothetical protein
MSVRPRSFFLCACLAAGLAATNCSAAEGPRTEGAYLVFEIDERGSVRPLHASPTPMTEGWSRRGRGAQRLPFRGTDAITVRTRDAEGAIAFQDVVDVPRVLRGEFHGDASGSIDGHLIREPNRVFATKLPVLRGGRVEIEAAGAAPAARASPATFSLDEISALWSQPGAGSRQSPRVLAGSTLMTAPPGQASMLPGWAHGSSLNRVDLLVVGEGYTAAEEAKFEAEALAVVEGMFQITPYSEYRNYVNVRTLFVASAQSGADRPPYDPGCSDYTRVQSCCSDAQAPPSGVSVDTAFDATFCSFNIQRLLTVNTAKVLIAASVAPETDQILVIVNTSEYGGSGGNFSVISTHGLAVEIAQHEYGHTFTRLADEYASPFPGYGDCSDTEAGVPRCESNVTDETEREALKWSHWVAANQAIPSVGEPPVATDAGLWAGARYRSSGMYRQGFRCAMRALGYPFCDVASEAYVLRLTRSGWGFPTNGIDLIEPGSESPSPGNTAIVLPGAVFSAQILGPQAGPDLAVRWLLDDVEIESTTAPSGAIVSYALEAAVGIHRLELRVTDRSPIVHDTLRALVTRSRVWNVAVLPETTTTSTVPVTTTTVPDSSTTTSLPPTTLIATTTTTSTTTTSLVVATSTTLTPTTTVPSVTTTTKSTDETTTSTTTTTTVDEPFLCARPSSRGERPTASDCLYILNTAVGVTACVPECVCAPKGSLPTTATDALLCLGSTVGNPVELRCPCEPLP